MKIKFLAAIALGFVAVVSPIFGQSKSDFRVSVDLNGTGVVIDSYRGKQREVIIPSQIHDFPVREIGKRAFWKTNVTSVTIPEGVTKIGEIAFCMCSDLTSITLPSTLKPGWNTI